jgi:cyclopropane fatty-acyl-phospholipid synthase-like methyltransferase
MIKDKFLNSLTGFRNWHSRIKLRDEKSNISTDIGVYRSHATKKLHGNSYEDKGFLNDITRHKAKIEYLQKNHLGKESKVLDIGCGFASFGYLLLTQILGSEGLYVGVDVSEKRIKHAKYLMGQAGLNCHLKVIYDIKDCLNFNETNWITIFSVFTHIFNEDIVNYLLIANQVLERGGRLCFSILDIESPDGLYYLNEMIKRSSRKRFKTEFYTIHSLDYIKTLLRYTGFQMIDSSFLPPNIQRFCIAEKIQEKSQLGKE